MYIYDYYSAIKKNEIMPYAATQIQPEIITLSEVNQKGKDKCHMISLIYGIENTSQINLPMKQSHGHKQHLVVAKGKDRVGSWGQQI